MDRNGVIYIMLLEHTKKLLLQILDHGLRSKEVVPSLKCNESLTSSPV